MLKAFLVCDSHNVDKMLHLVDEMKGVLAALDAGEVPNQIDYTRQDLLDYCKSLVKGQRGNIGRTKLGSWSDVQPMIGTLRLRPNPQLKGSNYSS